MRKTPWTGLPAALSDPSQDDAHWPLTKGETILGFIVALTCLTIALEQFFEIVLAQGGY